MSKKGFGRVDVNLDEKEVARTQTAPSRSSRRASRLSRSRRKVSSKRRAVVEVEVSESPDRDSSADSHTQGQTPSHLMDTSLGTGRTKRLVEIGAVFVLAAVINAAFFDKPSPVRRRKARRKGKKGGSKKQRGALRFDDGDDDGDDAAFNPFKSKSLTVEKGKMLAMMDKLDSTLNSLPPLPPVTDGSSQAARETMARLIAPDATTTADGKDDGDDLFADDFMSERAASDAERAQPKYVLGADMAARKVPTTAARLPDEDDFFADDPDDLFTSDVTEVEAEASEQFKKAFEGTTIDPDDDRPALPKPAPPSPDAGGESADRGKRKKGILGRLFTRGGEASRPTDLSTVLLGDGHSEEMQVFKAAVARALLSDVPTDLNPELRQELGGTVLPEEAKEMLMRTKEAAGLDAQQAAEAFAGVANCVMVAMVDRAADVRGRGEEAEEERLDALNAVAETMNSMSALFNSVGTGATIAPIVYNGSLGRGKIEKLYTSYARSALSLGNMLSGLGMGATKADGEKASSVESDDDDTDAVDPETKMIRLGQLEQLFGIREKKKNDVEAKVMREAMMGMLKGEGPGLGDLGGLMDSLGDLGGLGGADGNLDMEKLMEQMGGADGMEGMEEMMKQMGVDPSALMSEGGFPPDFNPDNMDPKEMAKMSADAMGAVKESLAAGDITKDDVAELEKLMGGDINELLSMMKGGNVDKSKLREMGPDLEELLSVFKDLAKIKNQ